MVNLLHPRPNSVSNDWRRKIQPTSSKLRSPSVCNSIPNAIQHLHAPSSQLVQSFGLGCHQYADDTQLYLMMDNQPNTPPTALTKCLEAVTIWLRQSHLKMNPQKTEVLWVGNKKTTDMEIHLPQLGGTTLTTSITVKSLGVILDASLSMEAQISRVAHLGFWW